MKFLGKWMDLEGIILSEVTQSQKNSYDMCSLISGYQPRNLEYPRYKLQFAKHMKLKKNEDESVDTFPLLRIGNKLGHKSLPLDSRLEPRATLPAESCPTPARAHKDGPYFCLSSKFCLCNSFHGCFVPNYKKGQSVHSLVFVLLEFHVFCKL